MWSGLFKKIKTTKFEPSLTIEFQPQEDIDVYDLSRILAGVNSYGRSWRTMTITKDNWEKMLPRIKRHFIVVD